MLRRGCLLPVWFVFVTAALVPAVAHAAAASALAAPHAALWDTLDAMDATGRYRVADSLVTALIAELDAPAIRDSATLARALSRQVAYRRIRGMLRDGKAAAVGERAVAIVERLRPSDPLALCRSHSAVAMALIDMGLGDSALVHARRGEDVARAAVPRDDSLLAMMYLREGQAQRIRADFAAGVSALTTGRDLMRGAKGDSVVDLGLIEGERASAFTYLGEFDAARAASDAAVRIAEQNFAKNPQRLEIALASRVTLERKVGHVAAAVDLAERVYELCLAREGPNGPQAHIRQTNLGYSLIALGDHQHAREVLLRSLPKTVAELAPTNPALLQMRVAIASACAHVGDFDTAAGQLDLVDSTLAAMPHPDASSVSYCTTVRSLIEVNSSQYLQARRRLLEVARRVPLELPARADLATIVYSTIRDSSDRAVSDSLGRSLDALSDTTEIAQTKNWGALLVSRAGAEARVGERERARAHAFRADSLANVDVRWQMAALGDDEALALDEEAPDATDVLVETARPAHADEVRGAWEVVFRRRGLVREVVEQRRGFAATGDTALAGAHARWIAAQRHHAQIVVSGALDGSDPETRQRFEASREAAEIAERRYAALSAAAGHAPHSASLDAVMATLAPGEALVAFVRTGINAEEGRLHAFIARGGDPVPRLLSLGPASEIASDVHRWVATLSTPPPADPRAARAAESAARAAGEVVRRRVWDPLLATLGDAKEIQIVPGAPVHDLPWLALPTAKGRYLADADVHLHVRPSERDLVEPPPPPARGLLAVGDPAFGPDAPRAAPAAVRRPVVPGGCDPSDIQLVDLPGAREEASAITKLWARDASRGPAELLAGTDATEQRFKELAPGRRVLHLATHGILTRDTCEPTAVAMRGVGGVSAVTPPAQPAHRKPGADASTPRATPEEEPETSPWLGREVWLAFAGANAASAHAGDENEGWLTADEVVTLDLRGTDRVVLSACQSGVVDRWTPEAVLGMRRAFHLAGARCVVASQWPIADTATREWMDAFYASPASSAGTALQDASRAVLATRRAQGRTTHPFYWAAFTATGD